MLQEIPFKSQETHGGVTASWLDSPQFMFRQVLILQQYCVDVMKHIFHKSVMEHSFWISLFPLQPAHTYGCPATSHSEKSYRRLPGSKKQIKYYHMHDFKDDWALFATH